MEINSQDPYKVNGPALISFSGGRTSGFMLKQIIEAWDGALPDDIRVVYANTGKERRETLDFIWDIEVSWGVKVHWVEWVKGINRQKLSWFKEVCRKTASKDGEPFQALIKHRNYLPNPVARFCTTELKVNPMMWYMLSEGFTSWLNVIGLRYDEPRRVSRANGHHESPKQPWINTMPISDAMHTIEDVEAFWDAQPFRLGLHPWESNCDLCFLKGMKIRERTMGDHPELAEWWIDMEELIGGNSDGSKTPARFRVDRPSYAKLLEMVQRQGTFGFDDETIPCVVCHD